MRFAWGKVAAARAGIGAFFSGPPWHENSSRLACDRDAFGHADPAVGCCGSRRPVCAGDRQFEVSRRRRPAEGAHQRRPRRRRRAQARRLQCRGRREPDRRRHAPRLRPPVRPDQARLGRAGILQRLRRAVQPPELHDPGRRPDLDRSRCPPRRSQPRDGAGRDQQPRRRGQDRPDRCLQAQSLRAALPQLFRWPRAGGRAERNAGDVFGGAVIGDFGQWQRSQPVRAGAAQGNPRSRPDGGRNPQPHPAWRHPRLPHRGFRPRWPRTSPSFPGPTHGRPPRRSQHCPSRRHRSPRHCRPCRARTR